MSEKLCDYQGCNNPASPTGGIFGSFYCKAHYFLGLEKALLEELPSLVLVQSQRKFMNLFSRYVEAVYGEKRIPMPEELTGNKLKARAENIQYHENAIIFTIERHPQPIPTEQRWRFDLRDKVFELIGEESVLLDCSEVAEILGKTVQTISRYIREGKIKANRASDTPQICRWFEEKLGRDRYGIWNMRNQIINQNKWLIPREEIERILSEGESP